MNGLKETVIRVRRTYGKFGDPTSSTDTPIAGCEVLFRTTGNESETFQQDIVAFDVTVVFPSGTDILVTDSAIVRGKTYQVVNTPIPLISPFTRRDSGIGVQLRATTG